MQYEGGLGSAFPGATLEVSQPVFRGDTAAVEWVWSGKNAGPLATPAGVVPATNRHMRVSGVSVLRFGPEGLIAEERRYYDVRTLYEQLGIP